MDFQLMQQDVLQGMPFGYALHQFVRDNHGFPCDYIFLDVNDRFEEMTGLSAADLIGKRLTDVLPDIVHDPFDWIGTYAKTAYQGEKQQLEQYSVPLKRWYRIDAYAPREGYFVTLIKDITAEKQQEKRLLEMQQILQRQEIIINIYKKDDPDLRSFLAFVLSSALKMVESQYGYIFLYDDEKRKFTINTWSFDVMPDCRVQDPDAVYCLEDTGIWGEVVRQGKPIVINDFQADHPLKKGYPEGHVPIRSFASIPVCHNGRIVAAVGVANKATDYTEFDINQLTMLMQSAWLIQETRLHREHLHAAIENHSAAMLFIEPDSGRIVFANPAATRFYGYTQAELLDMSIQDINMIDQPAMKIPSGQSSEDGQPFITLPHRLKSGEIKMVDVFSSFIEYESRSVLFSIIFDVTDKEEAMKEIRHLAFHDYLTGVYNRRYFDESFTRLNTPQNQPLAVIVGDINGLKLINDNYGHATGDELIRAAVLHMRLALGKEHILARTGGDEFAILLPQTTESEVVWLTNHLEEELERFIDVEMNVEADGKARIYLSVSFGYGLQNGHITSLDELVKQAEDHIYRSKAYHDRSMRSHMVGAMMNTLFQKSEREERHSHRVSSYCELMAKALSWNMERVNKTKVAGRLHDIGKIGISEVVLNKPGRLNDAEWAIMKQHPGKSARILESTEEFKEIAAIVAAHHERFDGSGYPRGLTGQQIPREALVIAVADAYDAMTQTRTYRQPMSRAEAIQELQRCSGTQFDPQLVDVFVRRVLLVEEGN